MIFSEEESYKIWSRMTDDRKDRINVMVPLFGLTPSEAEELDMKFQARRERTIWENSHALDFSRVILK